MNCKFDTKLRIILLISLTGIIMMILNIYIIIHNILIIDNVDILYTSSIANFEYILNGELKQTECNNIFNCSNVLYNIYKNQITDKDNDGYIKYNAIYNLTSNNELIDFDHYTRTTLILSVGFCIITALYMIFLFIIIHNLQTGNI